MSLDTKKEYFKAIPAVYLFLRQGDKVLLLQRANTGYQDGKYSVPAGHLEGEEVGTQAMVRETKEETGINVEPTTLKHVHTAHRLNDGRETERIDLFFEAHEWDGEITNMEPEKCDDLSWFPVRELPSNILPFIGIVIGLVEEGETYSEYEVEPT